MTVAELRQEATVAARVDRGLAITLLKAALRRRPRDPGLLWDKARLEYDDHRLDDCTATLLDIVDVALDLKAIAMLEKVLRRTGRSGDASAWYVVRRSLQGD